MMTNEEHSFWVMGYNAAIEGRSSKDQKFFYRSNGDAYNKGWEEGYAKTHALVQGWLFK